MITDLLGETVIEDYVEWKRMFMDEHGVTTHCNESMGIPWCAFVKGWDYMAENCACMEADNEMRFGHTEREALEALAKCLKYKLYA